MTGAKPVLALGLRRRMQPFPGLVTTSPDAEQASQGRGVSRPYAGHENVYLTPGRRGPTPLSGPRATVRLL